MTTIPAAATTSVCTSTIPESRTVASVDRATTSFTWPEVPLVGPSVNVMLAVSIGPPRWCASTSLAGSRYPELWRRKIW